MSELIPTIGLEIHAELKTQTKMFCQSKNDPDEKRPNVNVCPVCLAHPGTLPTINKKAVEHVLRTGLALGGTLADYTEFDRKNYFYPDIPKGYQISQYKFPLVSGGKLNDVELTRIHLEEDTARNQHGENESLIDFNRAGVPLMELVTEPVITSAQQAGDFAREFQLLLRYLNVSDADMEKGHLRVEANISIAPAGERGTKVEVKNLNSFKSVEKAIEYELARQKGVLESGEEVAQETRGWDEAKQVTFSQRKKESSHDYRYFPDPDLPKLKISEIPEFSTANLQKTIPELPWQKRERLLALGLQSQDVEMYIENNNFGELFTKTYHFQPGAPKVISNIITTGIVGLVSKFGYEGLGNIKPEGLASVVVHFVEGKISSRGVKDTILEIFTKGGDFTEVIKKNLQESNEGQLIEIITKIIADNQKVVEDYKAGKESALQFLIGQGMKASKGSANPEVLKKLLITALSTGSAL